MKTKITLLTAALGLAFLTQAQTTPNLDLSTYTKIDASGAPTVIYKNSDSLSLSITGKTEDAANIETRIVDGTLFIKSKGNIKSPVTVRINGNKLNSVRIIWSKLL
jgi:P pilus assembly chaperone PapD